MKSFQELTVTRRSVRRYRPDPVSDRDLDAILEAVRWSPSWANTQCWEVIVVREPERKRALQEILGRNPAHDAMVDAPVVLVLCGARTRAGYKRGEPVTRYGDWMLYDLGIANQNLCLAAHALGLGTVIVGSFDHDAVDALLGVPATHGSVTMIPLGYPDGETKAPPRREVGAFAHLETFGTPLKPTDE
jgi:nitroreductase